MASIFLSHSARDSHLAPCFDTLFARENIEAVRFEFEFDAQREDPIANLRTKLQDSLALFVLLTPWITATGTFHTGNWVCAEVGMARGLNIPIWVFDSLRQPTNFPVPFVDHYVLIDLSGDLAADSYAIQSLRPFVREYSGRYRPAEPWMDAGYLGCFNEHCQTVFQIHQSNHEIDRCPACCTPGPWRMANKTCINCAGRGVTSALLRSPSDCPVCNGSGALLVNMGSEFCDRCEGQGIVSPAVEHVGSVTARQIICVVCRGTGYQGWQLLRA
jgi:hypothetical protein